MIKKTKKNFNLSGIISVLLIVIGICLFLYPTISKLLVENSQQGAIFNYEEKVSTYSQEHINEEIKKAKEYNESLVGEPTHDPFLEDTGRALPTNYTDVLSTDNKGTIGFIRIPKIDVNIPVYHGTAADTLEKGVGHIRESDFPIGGQGTHSILTGHSGLPNATMFDNLGKMTNGDLFYITILDKTLCYKVDDIQVIEPSDLSKIAREKDKDYVSLITCTPYGVNTHRLVVRGERITLNESEENISDIKPEISTEKQLIYSIIFIMFLIFIFAIVSKLFSIISKTIKNQKKMEEKQINEAKNKSQQIKNTK